MGFGFMNFGEIFQKMAGGRIKAKFIGKIEREKQDY